MNKVRIIVDACCHIPGAHKLGRSGRGKSACGVLIIDENGQEHEFSNYLGEMTVPEAEFRALIHALDKAVIVSRRDIEVWTDSDLVVKWMKGEYRLKKEHIKPLFDKAKQFENRYRSVEYFHHPRSSRNAMRADQIAEKEYKKHQK